MRGWSGWLVVSPVRRNLPLLAFTLLALLSCPQNIRAQDVLVMPKSGEANTVGNRDSDVLIMPNANTVMRVTAIVPVTAGAVLTPSVHEDHVEYRPRSKANIFAPPLTSRQSSAAAINIPDSAKIIQIKHTGRSVSMRAVSPERKMLPLHAPEHQPIHMSALMVDGFEQELIPMFATSPDEDADLKKAITEYISARAKGEKFPETFSSFHKFLAKWPGSAWRNSIYSNASIAAKHSR